MKKTILTLLCISSLFAEVEVIESKSYYKGKVIEEDNLKYYQIDSICKDGYKYTVVTNNSGISIVQDMKSSIQGILPVQCNSKDK